MYYFRQKMVEINYTQLCISSVDTPISAPACHVVIDHGHLSVPLLILGGGWPPISWLPEPRVPMMCTTYSIVF